mmetsp:Transcript_91980/g.259870  ORF Transcript_91980/g.259870 Transcript_91980/m.259870 type:complete len:326 (-) Transcript_91980:894-1871(-)
MLALLALPTEEVRPISPSTLPTVASRFLLLSSVRFTDVDLPRTTLSPSSPFSLSSSAASLAFFLAFLGVGTLFLDFLSRFSKRFWRILLWNSSSTCCVSWNLFRTDSSSRKFASCMSNSSSRSNSSSLFSMSGSIKSLTLCPSMISGMTSYFQDLSSRIAFRHKSTEYTPAPPSSSIRSFSNLSSRPLFSADTDMLPSSPRCFKTLVGMQGGRLAGAVTLVTCKRLCNVSALPAFTFCSTRFVSNKSQAFERALSTPVRVAHEVSMKTISILSSSVFFIDSSKFRSSGDNSSSLFKSVLLRMMRSGRFRKSGLIEWKSATCCVKL